MLGLRKTLLVAPFSKSQSATNTLYINTFRVINWTFCGDPSEQPLSEGITYHSKLSPIIKNQVPLKKEGGFHLVRIMPSFTHFVSISVPLCEVLQLPKNARNMSNTDIGLEWYRKCGVTKR